MLVLGFAPSTPQKEYSLPSLPFVAEFCNALPFGREALKRLGGHEQTHTKAAAQGGFPMDKINVPLGVTPATLSNYNLYELLGFSTEWADSADVESIKKAYHRAVILYHPDKAQYKTVDGKEDRSVFLKIQEAFDILTNESKRRAYDSQLPFDESIPTEEKVAKALAKGPSKFFKLFNPVFKRNARFAVKKPVPDLGDMETPLNDVYMFYDYWVKFDSWRDFTGIGAEHNPDEAQNREEKRYMEKENQKLSKKLKKKEMDRIIDLVTISQKHDPRISAAKEAKKLAKDADRLAKEADSRQKAEEVAASMAWAAAEEAAAAERAAALKVDREKLKKLMSKGRNILRKLLRITATRGMGSCGEYGILSDADVELVCNKAELDDLTEINNAMGGEPATKDESLFLSEGVEVVQTKLSVFQEQAAEDAALAASAKKISLSSSSSSGGASSTSSADSNTVQRVWSREVLSVLAKGVARYPAGIPNRWARITQFLNEQLKPTDLYQQEEVLRAAYKAAEGLGKPH